MELKGSKNAVSISWPVVPSFDYWCKSPDTREAWTSVLVNQNDKLKLPVSQIEF
jgi:hypothetical protein